MRPRRTAPVPIASCSDAAIAAEALFFCTMRCATPACPRPLEWLAVEVEPGLYLPDWETMGENRHRILVALRACLEENVHRVSGVPDL